MSTLAARENIVHPVKLAQATQPSESLPRPVAKAGFSLRNLFTWYKKAVLSPETESEKEEWQKTSF